MIDQAPEDWNEPSPLDLLCELAAQESEQPLGR